MVFASAVGRHLLHFGRHLGYQSVLVDPVHAGAEADADAVVTTIADAGIDATTDVVITDHHRPELGPVLRDVLEHSPRWIGVMGSPRHVPPHVAALTELGASPADIDRVHRPIGLNIGSKTPPEIALATLAGLIADRTGGRRFCLRPAASRGLTLICDRSALVWQPPAGERPPPGGQARLTFCADDRPGGSINLSASERAGHVRHYR